MILSTIYPKKRILHDSMKDQRKLQIVGGLTVLTFGFLTIGGVLTHGALMAAGGLTHQAASTVTSVGCQTPECEPNSDLTCAVRCLSSAPIFRLGPTAASSLQSLTTAAAIVVLIIIAAPVLILDRRYQRFSPIFQRLAEVRATVFRE